MRRHKLKGGMMDDTPMEDQESYMVNPAAKSDVDGGDVTPGPMTRRGRAKASVSNVGTGVKTGVGSARTTMMAVPKKLKELVTKDAEGSQTDAETVREKAQEIGLKGKIPSLRFPEKINSMIRSRSLTAVDTVGEKLDKETESLLRRMRGRLPSVKNRIEARRERREAREEQLAYQAELEKHPLSDQPDAHSQSILKRQASELGVTVDDKGNIVTDSTGTHEF